MFVWLIDIFGFTEKVQQSIIYFSLPELSLKAERCSESEIESNRIDKDVFYRCCVKYDFVLFEEIMVMIQNKFKEISPKLDEIYL